MKKMSFVFALVFLMVLFFCGTGFADAPGPAIVNVAKLVVYEKPSKNASIETELTKGETVFVNEISQDGWALITYTELGHQGYVEKRNITLDANAKWPPDFDISSLEEMCLYYCQETTSE